MAKKYRQEKDSFGNIRVDADAYWGAHTQRAKALFCVGEEMMPLAIIHAFGIQKKATAQANKKEGILESHIADAIITAANELAQGALDMHFPLSVWQTGSGTHTHMNVNEVLARRASNILGDGTHVHPNDHVNASQSTNDSFPTAMHIAFVTEIFHSLLPQLSRLKNALAAKENQWNDVVKIGRTHYQDATPLTFGHMFSGYRHQIECVEKQLADILPFLYAIPQGGTAVGTGINAPKNFSLHVCEALRNILDMPFSPSENMFASIAAHDAAISLSGILNTLASIYAKLAGDIRFLGSGPRCGIGELTLPANEAGSSIMPGKVNPTQAESMLMVAARVIGNHTSVTFAAAGGHCELNTFKPLIAYTVLQSLRLLADSAKSMSAYCIEGLTYNADIVRQHLENSLMHVTALSPTIGYDNATSLAKEALEKGMPLKTLVLDKGYLSADEFDALVSFSKLAGLKDKGETH